MGYLDNDGLSYLWGKIKAALAKKQDPLLSSGAAVGDLVRVKSVDAAGKPTAWEPVQTQEADTADIPEGLPAVTEADNGKVMRVIDGAWGTWSLSTEQFIFTLEDGTQLAKYVYVEATIQ